MNIFRTNVLIVVFLLCSMAHSAESAEWLGEYVGSGIPGYEIVKSFIKTISSSGGPTEDKLPRASELAIACKKEGGKAIVNVRLVYSLGEVTWKEKDGSMTNISPGATGIAYGDCVSEVKKQNSVFQ